MYTESADGEKIKAPSPGGSLFVFNNTSYSGSDIKVVINNYDTAGGVKEKLQDLDGFTETAFEDFETLQGRRSAVLSKLSSAKQGTPDAKKLQSELVSIERDINISEQAFKEMMARSSALRGGLESNPSKVLAEIQTLSLSVYRGKTPVKSFGTTYPKAYARGGRMISGSCIFAVFNEHVLYRFLEAHASDFDGEITTTAILDQLPPVDITVVFANEYGSLSRLAIYGVEFITEGQTMSIEDIMTENVVNYVARDYDPMRSVAQRKLDENSIMISEWHGKKGSELIMEDEYQNIKSEQDPFHRHSLRNNRFI